MAALNDVAFTLASGASKWREGGYCDSGTTARCSLSLGSLSESMKGGRTCHNRAVTFASGASDGDGGLLIVESSCMPYPLAGM